MSNWALNNITAPDNYAGTSTLDGLPLVSRLNIDCVNQPIYWQLKQVKGLRGSEGMATWGNEVFMMPGSRSLFRQAIVGIRIRAAMPAAQIPVGFSQAQVTVEAIA